MVRRGHDDRVDLRSAELHRALLQTGAKERAVIGLVLINYSHFKCSIEELGRISRETSPSEILSSVLAELTSELGI